MQAQENLKIIEFKPDTPLKKVYKNLQIGIVLTIKLNRIIHSL